MFNRFCQRSPHFKVAVFASCVLGFLAVALPGLNAQGTAGPVEQAAPALETLKKSIADKAAAGKSAESDYREELVALDALSAKLAATDKATTAEILLEKANLYGLILGDRRALPLLERIAADYSETPAAGEVDLLTIRTKEWIEGRALIGKPAPALKFEWSTEKGLASLADKKGKVVVLDFWATWCVPCINSFPEIRELAEHYRGYDVEVLGVTSLQGRIPGLRAQPIDTKGNPEKEKTLLAEFARVKGMTWTLVLTGENVFNPSFGIGVIPYLAVIAPDGTVREAAWRATSLAERTKVIDSLLREFKKPFPNGQKVTMIRP